MFLKKLDDAEGLSFSIPQFEGPLELLLYLIQKEEIKPFDVSLLEIINQYQKQTAANSIDAGAEFIAQAAVLLWLKSKSLLPPTIEPPSHEEEPDPQFEVIHHLVDYCRFKELAKVLIERADSQSDIFARGTAGPGIPKKPTGLEHVSLEDLAGYFQNILSKNKHRQGTIKEEALQVSDLIRSLRQLINKEKTILFAILFDPEKSRIELIVTFLALLELMKMGEIVVARKSDSEDIYILNQRSYEPGNQYSLNE